MDVEQEVIVLLSVFLSKSPLCSGPRFSTFVHSLSDSLQLQGSECFYFL